MPEPTPYEPEPGWAFYQLGDVPDDWQVRYVTLAAGRTSTAKVVRGLGHGGVVLARPPEPELIAVMLPADFVGYLAKQADSNVLSDSWQRIAIACRAALAASPVSER